MVSDDGRFAIVELRAARRAALQKVTDQPGPAARVLEPGRMRAADLESEIKLLKRDFRWEQFGGIPALAAGESKKSTEKEPGIAREAGGERAAYSYYFNDTFATINTTNWTKNGDLTGGAEGLKAASAAGGSLIAATNPTNSSYEISSTLKINAAGGVYSHFLRASSNARAGSGVTAGTYYLVELAVTSYVSGGSCGTVLTLQQVTNGVVSTLSTGNTSCRDGMEFRTYVTPTGGLHVFLDGGWATGIWSGVGGAGLAGVGMRGSVGTGSIKP